MTTITNEGYVKGVLSGDYIIISGKLKKNPDEVPDEKSISLALVQAPRINSNTTYEEDPFAWESRNYLRNLLIGKVIKYTVESSTSDNIVGQVFIDKKNVNLELIKRGLAKVNTQRANETLLKSEFTAAMKLAETEAEKKKIGIWKTGEVQRIKITKPDEVNV